MKYQPKNLAQAFQAMLDAISRQVYTQDELIYSIAAFARDKQSGKCENWGLSGFVTHINRWLDEARGKTNVYLICSGCKKRRIMQRCEWDHCRQCYCGGSYVLDDDQAQRKREAEWKRPGNGALPTLDELQSAFDNADKNGNMALCRIIVGQMEKGAFKNSVGVANES